MNSSERKYSFLEAKAKIEAWCAYQERCHFEVWTKLRTWNIDEEDTNTLIADLITNNFLNEQRFAEAYVSGKVSIKKWGKSKIKAHLKQKRISETLIKKALTTIDETVYWDNLIHLATRKWHEKKGDGYSKRQKVSLFLYQKGYEASLISEALEHLLEKGLD